MSFSKDQDPVIIVYIVKNIVTIEKQKRKMLKEPELKI